MVINLKYRKISNTQSIPPNQVAIGNKIVFVEWQIETNRNIHQSPKVFHLAHQHVLQLFPPQICLVQYFILVWSTRSSYPKYYSHIFYILEGNPQHTTIFPSTPLPNHGEAMYRSGHRSSIDRWNIIGGGENVGETINCIQLHLSGEICPPLHFEIYWRVILIQTIGKWGSRN